MSKVPSVFSLYRWFSCCHLWTEQHGGRSLPDSLELAFNSVCAHVPSALTSVVCLCALCVVLTAVMCHSRSLGVWSCHWKGKVGSWRHSSLGHWDDLSSSLPADASIQHLRPSSEGASSRGDSWAVSERTSHAKLQLLGASDILFAPRSRNRSSGIPTSVILSLSYDLFFHSFSLHLWR